MFTTRDAEAQTDQEVKEAAARSQFQTHMYCFGSVTACDDAGSFGSSWSPKSCSACHNAFKAGATAWSRCSSEGRKPGRPYSKSNITSTESGSCSSLEARVAGFDVANQSACM